MDGVKREITAVGNTQSCGTNCPLSERMLWQLTEHIYISIILVSCAILRDDMATFYGKIFYQNGWFPC